MYTRYITILLSASFAFGNLTANTKAPNTLSNEQLQELVQELAAPLSDGFQAHDLFVMASVLQQHLSSMENLSLKQKKDAAIYLLQEALSQRYHIPSFEKSMLQQMLPALATILFPTSIDTSLEQPQNPSPTEKEIFDATNNLLLKLDNKLDWSDISDCILYVFRFASSYQNLPAQDRAYIAKQILKEVIDKTDTPFLPDVIFDEVFKRIGYAMIDYLTVQN